MNNKHKPIKVHQLLVDKSNWTQGRYALDIDGKFVHPGDKAVCWCLWGAIIQVYVATTQPTINSIIDIITPRISYNYSSITDWNDDPDRTFEQVRNLCVELDI